MMLNVGGGDDRPTSFQRGRRWCSAESSGRSVVRDAVLSELWDLTEQRRLQQADNKTTDCYNISYNISENLTVSK